MSSPSPRAGLGLLRRFRDEISGLITMLGKSVGAVGSADQARGCLHRPVAAIKQLLGDAATKPAANANVMVSNTLAKQPLPAEPMLVFTANMAKHQSAWAMLEQMAAGLTLPASLTKRNCKASRNFRGLILLRCGPHR